MSTTKASKVIQVPGELAAAQQALARTATAMKMIAAALHLDYIQSEARRRKVDAFADWRGSRADTADYIGSRLYHCASEINGAEGDLEKGSTERACNALRNIEEEMQALASAVWTLGEAIKHDRLNDDTDVKYGAADTCERIGSDILEASTDITEALGIIEPEQQPAPKTIGDGAALGVEISIPSPRAASKA